MFYLSFCSSVDSFWSIYSQHKLSVLLSSIIVLHLSLSFSFFFFYFSHFFLSQCMWTCLGYKRVWNSYFQDFCYIQDEKYKITYAEPILYQQEKQGKTCFLSSTQRTKQKKQTNKEKIKCVIPAFSNSPLQIVKQI